MSESKIMTYEGAAPTNIKVTCTLPPRLFCEKDDRDKYCEIGISTELVKGKVLPLTITVFHVLKKTLTIVTSSRLLKWDVYMYMLIKSLSLEEKVVQYDVKWYSVNDLNCLIGRKIEVGELGFYRKGNQMS